MRKQHEGNTLHIDVSPTLSLLVSDDVLNDVPGTSTLNHALMSR